MQATPGANLAARPAAIPVITPDALRKTANSARKRGQLKGRQPDAASLAQLRALIGPRPSEGHRRDLLIEHLHRINDAHDGLPDQLLVALASEMNLPMAEVYEVASFYHHFDILRDGVAGPALTVRVCTSLSCSLAGADGLLAQLPALLGPEVRVLPAPCLGRCEQAPAVQVGQRALAHATAQAVFEASKMPLAHIQSAQLAPELVAYDAYRAAGGYSTAAAIVNSEHEADAVLTTMESAGLRGLGGAGFPAGRKWRIVRDQPAPRLMAVNIDEGEPGTFKDRFYLERDPHRFLEGLLIAAQVVGCEAVYIYLRDEYHDCRKLLTRRARRPASQPTLPVAPHRAAARRRGRTSAVKSPP